jgi:hypothetical protein
LQQVGLAAMSAIGNAELPHRGGKLRDVAGHAEPLLTKRHRLRRGAGKRPRDSLEGAAGRLLDQLDQLRDFAKRKSVEQNCATIRSFRELADVAIFRRRLQELVVNLAARRDQRHFQGCGFTFGLQQPRRDRVRSYGGLVLGVVEKLAQPAENPVHV